MLWSFIPNQTKTLFDQQLTKIRAKAETELALPFFFRGVTKSLIVKVNSKVTRILFRTSCENITFCRKTCRRNCENITSYQRRHAMPSIFRGTTKTLFAKVNSKYTRILFTTSCSNVKQEKISTKLRKHMHLMKEDVNEWSNEWSTSWICCTDLKPALEKQSEFGRTLFVSVKIIRWRCKTVLKYERDIEPHCRKCRFFLKYLIQMETFCE